MIKIIIIDKLQLKSKLIGKIKRLSFHISGYLTECAIFKGLILKRFICLENKTKPSQ